MNERPDTERIKAELAADIVRIIVEQKLSDADACARLGITDADLARLRGDEGTKFSFDQLVQFLNVFDRQVDVRVGPAGNPLRSLIDYIDEVSATIPSEELDKLPTDMAANIDHYLYGSPRRD